MNERQEILDWTVELSHECGKRAVALFHKGMAIEKKADTTLVTNIDRAIESFIRDAIGDRFPGHGMFGEEEGMDTGIDPDAPLWAIDPIDGTANMAHGLPLWCISIGLIMDNVPVVGVVHAPMLNETHAGALGLGATRNGVPLPMLSADVVMPDKEDLYACCSTSVRRADFGRMPSRIRIPGSAAMNLCWTADGRFIGGQGIGTDLYDVAAGICIAHEVGGETRWLSGGEAWTAAGMIQSGRRPDALVTASRSLMPLYLREIKLVRP